jgi:hypothetical protein
MSQPFLHAARWETHASRRRVLCKQLRMCILDALRVACAFLIRTLLCVVLSRCGIRFVFCCSNSVVFFLFSECHTYLVTGMEEGEFSEDREDLVALGKVGIETAEGEGELMGYGDEF